MVRPADTVDVYAHRGSTILAPENTSRAFDLALSFGADVLETDVRLSRDGHVVVTHDARLERTTDGRGRVREHDLAALERLDAGHRFIAPGGRPARGDGVRLLTLAGLFERYPETAVNIDIKDSDPHAAEAVARVIERAGAGHRVTVGSFHAATLARFRAAAPEVDTAATRAEVARLYFSRWLSGDPARRPPLGCRCLQIPLSWRGIPLATPAFIAASRARGIDVIYWTINDPAQMRVLVARGARGIVTDRPDLARALFGTMA